MVTITIKTDNAAFHDEDGNPDKYWQQLEVCRILTELVKRLEITMQCGDFVDKKTLMDTNGNRVGEYKATIERE